MMEYGELFEGPVKDIIIGITSAGKEIAEKFAKVGIVRPGIMFQIPNIFEVGEECSRKAITKILYRRLQFSLL